MRRLGRKAAHVTAELHRLHWDNCKVEFDREAAFRFVWGSLRDGHDVADILRHYERALYECHAIATDRTASRGEVCRFEIFSTVHRARAFLSGDGLSKDERIRRWNANRRAKALLVPESSDKTDVGAPEKATDTLANHVASRENRSEPNKKREGVRSVRL